MYVTQLAYYLLLKDLIRVRPLELFYILNLLPS